MSLTPIAPLRTATEPVLANAAQAAAASSTTTAQASDDRDQAFRAVEGGGDMQSGEMLLVEAYAAIWLLALLLILHTWRRQRGLEARLEGLTGDIERARAAAGDGAADD